jgi:SAM-dependent methyltransferase
MSSTALSKLNPVDSSQTNGRYQVWKHVIPLPPDSLIWTTGGASIENFLVMGDAWCQLIAHFLMEKALVLDIGCGCGRVPRMLVGNTSIEKYIGFDVIKESVDWCNTFIKPAWKAPAEFHWFDLYSAEYNPVGKLKAENLHFPAADRSVDVVFASSLFTHLLEPDATNYLREVGRVLTKRGRALLSIHNQPALGTRFSGNELRIDIAPDYFVELAAKAGLSEIERIEDFGGQQVSIFALTS